MHTAEARKLAEAYLSESDSLRWRHVQGVASHAEKIVSGDSDAPVLQAAWLHDIGYGPSIASTGFHALDGALWLRKRGVDPRVVSLVAFHTGAEFEAEERGLLDELNQFERPSQESLDLLILCDLTVSPTGEDIVVGARLDEIVRRYLASDPVHRAVRRSSEYLLACCARAASVASAEERGVAVF
ncbi:HD domain-containing protein [Phycicoccus sp. MAQZ13P-2]|uniref:HD domain-containing protein n=1 Tax=Phycicoccus mangrovi TaxID=2840470 RepID=UPI001C00062B|nr:HD domain-containing protein [Phycicoccus mangrovi]MBT9275965.1 HD domain-containing protein [Phycicoccus mangrovi]